MLDHWAVWLIGGLVLALGAGVFTLVWWKVGDQWADSEYKRFGHGGGSPGSSASETTVIRDFDGVGAESGGDDSAEKRD